MVMNDIILVWQYFNDNEMIACDTGNDVIQLNVWKIVVKQC